MTRSIQLSEGGYLETLPAAITAADHATHAARVFRMLLIYCASGTYATRFSRSASLRWNVSLGPQLRGFLVGLDPN